MMNLTLYYTRIGFSIKFRSISGANIVMCISRFNSSKRQAKIFIKTSLIVGSNNLLFWISRWGILMTIAFELWRLALQFDGAEIELSRVRSLTTNCSELCQPNANKRTQNFKGTFAFAFTRCQPMLGRTNDNTMLWLKGLVMYPGWTLFPPKLRLSIPFDMIGEKFYKIDQILKRMDSLVQQHVKINLYNR